MKSYYLSKLNINQWENSTNKIFNFEKFISGKDINYSGFREVCRKFENKENCILLRFFETNEVKIKKFHEEDGAIKPSSEDASGFYVKISCAILPQINGGLMVTNTAGLSVILRGLGGRRYVDNVVGPMISKHLLGNSLYYSPFSFDQNVMKWELWGEELKGFTADILGLGRCFFSGQNLSSKKVGNNRKISLTDIISSGDIRIISVRNKSVGRTISVNRNGTIYSSQDLLSVVSFLNDKQKAIFL